MLVITSHESRIKQIPLGPATAHPRTHEPVQPKHLELPYGPTIVRDPETCKIILENSVFKRAVQACKVQRQANKKLRGLDVEEFPDVPVEVKKTAKAPITKKVGESAVQFRARQDAFKKAPEVEVEVDTEGPTVNPYRTIPQARMKEIILNTVTIKALQEMLAVEDRAPLSAAITARMKALRKDLADNTKSEDNDD